MRFFVRPINGTLGGAIAVSDSAGKEYKLAVFADGRIKDFVSIDSNRCLLISHKRGIAIVDLVSGEVTKRSNLPRPFDRIAVSGDGARALAYNCDPGLLAFIDLTSLCTTAEFNLIQLQEDGAFELLHRDIAAMRETNTPWDSIPYSDSSFRDEVRTDNPWLKVAPDKPTGLRRMRFTHSARAVFRKDGKVVLPFQFAVNGPEWISSRGYTRPITSSAHVITVGIAVVDESAAHAEMQIIRQLTELNAGTVFPVLAISPDGTRALLQSYDPLGKTCEPEAPATAGILRKIFGRKESGKLAFGLEQWNIVQEPKLENVFPFRSLDNESLLPINTQCFNEAQLREARRDIDLVFPGLEATFSGRQDEWLRTPAKAREDAYFDPLETRKAPAYSAAFNRITYPPLFAEAAERLVKLHPKPFSHVPWDRMSDRQSRLLSEILHGWSKHCSHAANSVFWVDTDRFVVLSRDGKVREISAFYGVGEAYQLTDPETQAWPFSNRDVFPPELQHVTDRTYAVDLVNLRLEFELPPFAKSETRDLERKTPLNYRLTIDAALHGNEVKQVDRLTEKIRRGYIKIRTKDANDIIGGLHEMAKEVREHLGEIIVDNRWIPTLYSRGKPVTETEICGILSADGSQRAVEALDSLLTAFLDATEDRKQNIWHPDDQTPTMGPTSVALINLCDSLPPAIDRFYARRDMDHDMWTLSAFDQLKLPTQRFLATDMIRLQIRLAIQDICTGNVDTNIFAHYRLNLVRDALHMNPKLASELAEVIVNQAEAQAPAFTWASNAGANGVVKGIAESINSGVRAEADLAAMLMHLAENRSAESIT